MIQSCTTKLVYSPPATFGVENDPSQPDQKNQEKVDLTKS